MPVQHEIKSQLAKLLATEDLVVEHKKVDTAEFNVHTRVLTLPMWEKASNGVIDSLVAHEVGHALYTPDIDWSKDRKVPHGIVNVVEDARIEKLMKRRYAGLAKTFYYGYQELNDNDFFDINNQDLYDFNLADRVNLHFKVGNFVDIPFSDAEKEIVDLVGSTESFDDALDASEVLYKFMKQKMEDAKEEQKQAKEIQTEFGDIENGQDEMTEEELEETMENGYGGTDQHDPSQELSVEEFEDQMEKSGGMSGSETLDVETMEAFDNALKNLSEVSGVENVYVELPKLKVNKIIISNEKIHDEIDAYWAHEEEEYHKRREEYNDYFPKDRFEKADQDFIKFKRSAQKEVSYLVKEFEMKKSADAYARSATARTGVLDTSKLHTYKFNEDLFKKVTVLPDGKNHGLVFILDWSGSMGRVMLDTLKQLYNLIWFCRKVSIPFEVYAFTNDYPTHQDGIRHSVYDKKEGVIHVCDTFSLMNLFTHKVNSKTLEYQMKNIFRIATKFNDHHWNHYNVPLGMNLSGTPLNETLIALHEILPQFKTQNKLQKVQCVILTDGEAYQVRYHKEFKHRWEEGNYMGTSYIGTNCFLRDRKIGSTYQFDDSYWGFTDTLLRNLQDKFVDVNFVGIRVLESRDAGAFIRRYCGYQGNKFDQTMKDWKKDKAFSIKTSGYNSYFGINSSSLSENDDFAVNDDATKAQIKRAFVKSLKTKKMNKKILGEFVELVA